MVDRQEADELPFCLRVMSVVRELGILDAGDGEIVKSKCETSNSAEEPKTQLLENATEPIKQQPDRNGDGGCHAEHAATGGEVSSASSPRRVIIFHQPEALLQLLPFSLSESALEDWELLQLCRTVGELSVRTDDGRFRNQLYGAVDPYGLAGALLTECLNTSQYTYEVAPVFTLCEQAVIEHICRLIGWPQHQGEGLFSPGASLANMYALALARYRSFPEVKQKGMSAVKAELVILTSEEAHYSVLKSAHWLGLGCDNVIRVRGDDRGRMDPEHLRDTIELVLKEGRYPLAVVATAGTTVLGAYDPLPAVASLCDQYSIWLHVDAAWGGAALLSPRQRHLLNGVERADSVVWNPHKMLGAPLQCSVLLVKQPGLLIACNSASASYLFQQDKGYDTSYDTGDRAVQCGRKVDAFKLWLMWKARGGAGFAARVDAAFSAAELCGSQVSQRDGFRLVLPSIPCQCTNVCFWYVPPALRNQRETPGWWRHLGRVAPLLKCRMMGSGTLMVGYQPLPQRHLPNFFRLVFTCHPPPSSTQVTFILDEIQRLGSDLSLTDLQTQDLKTQDTNPEEI